jgi:hypothetical protein
MDEEPPGAEETLFVATRETERGSKGPFYVVYTGAQRETRWGFYCSNCETLDTAVDTMGRIQCNRCSNLRKADEWDAAHE